MSWPTTSPRRDVISGVKRGDRGAIAQFCEEWYSSILRAAVYVCVRLHITSMAGLNDFAEVIAQETFLSLLMKNGLNRYRDEDRLRNYLFGVVLRTALNLRRRERYRQCRRIEGVPEPKDEGTPFHQLLLNEFFTQYMRAEMAEYDRIRHPGSDRFQPVHAAYAELLGIGQVLITTGEQVRTNNEVVEMTKEQFPDQIGITNNALCIFRSRFKQLVIHRLRDNHDKENS
jgi:DNA-directed RNA polymerase specialized sigma24 family protein